MPLCPAKVQGAAMALVDVAARARSGGFQTHRQEWLESELGLVLELELV